MKHIFQVYQKKLINLSGTNRSLFLPRLSVLNDIDMHETDFLLNKSSFSHIANLIEEQHSVALCKKNDSRNELNTLVSNRLKAIQRRSDFITEERGVHDLCVGWPFVNGIFNDGTPLRCPLLLWPVKLVEESNEWKLIQEGTGVVFNKSFLLAYSYFNHHQIDEQLIESFESDHSTDPLIFRTQLFELLKNTGIELQFNRDTFIDKLTFFQEYKRADFDLLFKKGELKLFSEAVLGIFPSFGSYLAPDYDFLIEKEGDISLENFFLNRTSIPNEPSEITSDNFIHSVKEEQVITPFSIDIFQENILKSVKKGCSVVVQGPPGTGKSQLIANLTSDYIARGKRVLVVCEKRVALDVIYERFKQIGIDDFIALVHDAQHDRGRLYHKMATLIQAFDEHKRNTQTIDAIRTEQQFTETSRRIEQITSELDEFKSAWYNDHDFGISMSELILLCDYQQAFIDVKNIIKYVDHRNLASVRQRLSYYFFYIQKLPNSPFWENRLSFANKTKSFKLELIASIHTIRANYQDIVSKLTFEYQPKSLHELQAIYDDTDLLKCFKSTIQTTIDYRLFLQMSIFKKDMQILHGLKKKIATQIHDICLINNGLSDFFALELKVQDAIDHYKSIFKKISFQYFSKDYKLLVQLLQANHLPNTLEGLFLLQKRIVFAIEIKSYIDELQSIKGLNEIDIPSHNIVLLAQFIDKLTEIQQLKAAVKTSSIPAAMVGESFQDLHHNVDSLVGVVNQWKSSQIRFLSYFSFTQIDTLLFVNELDSQEIVGTLDLFFDTYEALDAHVNTLEPYEVELAKQVLERYPNHQDYNGLLNNSFAIAWKEFLEEKFPILRLYKSDKFNLLGIELRQLILMKTSLSKDVLQVRLQENIHKHVEYNRLSNRVTYRDLLHQVSKKKKIWPIRKLVSMLSDDIFKLMPCWLASPETVSAAFPMEQYFDLVIFDEASQCFAERGIPAMYRAKQVVVTGDSMQLSPNDLYKVRWSEEDDDIPELAYDSLLDVCGRYFKSLMLKQHYRSSDPTLIAFSNEHFYNNSLIYKNIPKESNQKAIEFNFIPNAVWKNRSNQMEAQEVIHLIQKLQSQYPTKSIGIVTFNYHQQELIYSLIQEAIHNNYLKFDPRLIVKNIENIQGDERDIIIFSIGYAPDERGKLQMNFGSLSGDHGEKRLNVAITRAKEKIYILSSLLPEQLQVDQVLHDGPKLFKKYLQQVKNNEIDVHQTVREYEWHECLSMKYHLTK